MTDHHKQGTPPPVAGLAALTPCKWCDAPTPTTGGRECGPCRALREGMQANPDVAIMMMRTLSKEAFYMGMYGGKVIIRDTLTGRFNKYEINT